MSGYLKTLLFGLVLGHTGLAVGGSASTGGAALVGDAVAGEARYKQSCVNCHGAGGKGVASYPKVSGQDIAYTTEKLEQYRDGVKFGPNSSLMIMMAKPLSDQEIADLATYLKDA
ncbi:MAG: c-type cytochrome [Pseudomonadota bacterium]